MPAYTIELTSSVDNKSPTAERVYHAIRQMVANGRFGSGRVISEVRLASELEVSRTPVREAVRRLVGENVLEVTQHGLRFFSLGLEVTPMASTDFGQYLKRETQNWGDLVRVSGATPE